MSCVNTSSKEFKEMSKELNVKPSYLEMVIYKFQNTVGNEDNFPTKEYVMNTLKGKPFESSNEQLDIYINNKYNIPLTFATEKLASNKVNELRSIYPDNSVTMYQNNDREYVVTVGTPMLKSIPFALDNTLIDTFLGITKDTNQSYGLLFNTLVSLIGKENISINQLKYNTDINPKRNPAFYSSSKRKIFFFPELIQEGFVDNGYTPTQAKKYLFITTTHELLHQVSHDALNNPKTPEQKAFANRINNLYKEAKELFKGEKDYGLTEDVHEFFAEILTNKDFQLKMASKKRANGTEIKKSIWSKFVDAFYDFFKNSFGVDINKTILADVLSATSDFLESEFKLQEEEALFNEAAKQMIAEEMEGEQNLPSKSFSTTIDKLTKLAERPHNAISVNTYGVVDQYSTNDGKIHFYTFIPKDNNIDLIGKKNKVRESLKKEGINPDRYKLGKDIAKVNGYDVLYIYPNAQFVAQGVNNSVENKVSQIDKGRNYTKQELEFLNHINEVRPDLIDKIESGLIDLEDLIHEGEIGHFAEPFSDKESIQEEYTSITEINKEMQDIKAKAIADGTFMKAPNGNTSNLNERQWLQVRTKNFINWFGDWEKVAPKNIRSNFITANGEVNWEYFEQTLDNYHNSQPDSMFAKGRTTLATRPEKHFEGEKNTLNHIKFVTQSMLDLFEGKFDADLPFVSEARASLQNQKDLMVLAAMFHDTAKPYRHGDIHGWESADILRDIMGIDYNNRLAEWAVRNHMAMPFSHKSEFNLSNPEAIEVARNMARDAKRIGIDAQTAINAFVLINAADVINGREITVEDNWAKKAKAAGNSRYGDDISVKSVLTIELNEKVDLLKKAFDDIKDEQFGNSEQNYRNQSRFDYVNYPEGGRTDGKLPYLSNITSDNTSKVVDENGEPLVVYHGSKVTNIRIIKKNDHNSGYYFTSDINYAKDKFGNVIYQVFLNIKNPVDLRLTYNKNEYGAAYYKGRKLNLHEQAEMELNHKNVDSKAPYYIKEGYDGIFGNDSVDTAINGEEQIASEGTEYVVWYPNQIKSATDNLWDMTVNESSETPKGLTVSESTGSYAQRTKENAEWSDVTLAFAVDFNTAGEKATRRVAKNKYVASPLPTSAKERSTLNHYANEVYKELKSLGKTDNIKLNIAGNGIYTLSKFSTQEELNQYLYDFLSELQNLGVTISEVRSGGQTGVDEAGIVAALKLGIPCTVHAPKGFKFRDSKGNDISNKEQFLSRFNGIEVTQRAINDSELTESEEAKTSVTEDPFIARQLEIQKQIDNLLNDNIISATEVRHIAEQVVYYISDHITEMQKDPESAVKKYGDRLKGKNLSEMSRADIVRAIGPDNIIAYCKEVFSPEHHEEWDDDVLIDKAILITDNWDAIMQLASDVFLNNEKFTIISSSDGKMREVNEELNADADDFNASNMESEVEETEGSLQEHWQVESKTIDVLDSMSQLVRQALQQCYLLDKDGNEIVSEWGIKERVNAREATNSILRWTQGALTLADMVEKLKGVQESNPWVSQLINRLSDNSGKESDFQSQFFSVFCKPFQSYSVVTVEDGKYKSINVNESPALREAVSQVTTQYKIGEHPLFTTEGINKESLAELDKAFESLNKFKHTGNEVSKEVFKKEASETLGYISNLLGYYVIPDMVASNLTEDNFRKMYSALYYIVKALKSNVDNKTYEPFKFRSKDSITGNLREFLKPITEHLEDTAVSAFYDSGKMYQSYITPSYMTLLMQKFNYLEGEEFDKFIKDEYGQYSWFHTGNNIETGWKWSWLKEIVTDSKAKELFKHKVQLNFNKKNYMRNMSDVEYALSILTEYWSESTSDKQDRVPAWFRVAMLSNKPSSEFIRFYSERGINYKETIVNNMHDIFDAELCRIQTVRHRNLTKENPRYMENFDKNGKRFMFLSFLNDYLDGKQKSSELGKLLNDKLDGKKVDEVKLYDLVNKAIFDAMNEKATSIVNDWISQGILEGAKKIKGIGNTEEEIKANLENFVWNDAYASMNIMALTISDIAFYKNADDLQKRMAQIHSPGIRGNAEARDYKGNKVTDGKVRHIVITDFDNFISNVIDNVSVVFDRRIASATGKEKESLKALKESLVGKEGAYRHINVADAQAYNSPTSYRKKAFMFGRWSEEAEKTYERLRRGEKPTYSDLMIAFQPLKPFLYGSHSVNTGVNDANLLQNLKVDVQCKNSEYLLILADAITQGEETGKPNLLRALYEVMEESHFDTDGNYKLDGIDTVQFESAIKTGKGATIDISKYADIENGEAIAKSVLKSCIYQTETKKYESEDKDGNPVIKEANVQVGGYNLDFVNEMPAEAYSLQQEVPEHFKDHAQVHGSQLRYIIPSELAEVDTFGNPVTFDVEGRKLSAKEFKKEYENTIADNIEESINDLAELLHIDKFNYKERNTALSKILQREILSSPRYGVDLLQACSIDENGKFRIPLGDPIQSKRIEQLLNSIIKNRVNKQEIAGGPVVQVSNFGTSRQLSIKFKDKNGGFLKTRNEFEGTDAEFLKYIEENQGGIAYFEVYAPIYSNELFKKFADKDGNIDIQTIEQIDPELLKMVGYRIPTEAKYSAAPLKIVGFLPREAGDGIMFPYEITLLNGSDFDVDKAYLMRKEIDIATRFIQKENESMSDAEKDYVKHNKKSIADYLVKAVNLRGKTTAEERTEIVKKATSNAEYEKRLAKRIHEENLRKIEERSKTAEDVIDNKELSDKEYDKQSDKEEKFYEKSVKKENERYEAELAKIDTRKDEAISNNISKLEEKKVRERIEQFLTADKFTSSRSDDALTRELRKAYIAYMYHSVTPTSGRTYRNNKIVDMTYEVLTHETSCAEMLNPGGFEPQKKMGYLVTAYKSKDNTKSWEELSAMNVSDLKNLSFTDKNLCFIDTQVQFYRQNAAAASLIGIFAVHRTAHAVIENEGYQINIDNACKIDQPFIVAGVSFGGNMPIDVRYDRSGVSVGKSIGSLVACAADAVKDPVLNLMNINISTANILTALERLGVPFEDVALFLSQSAITRILNKYSTENVTSYTTLSKVIDARIKELEASLEITEASPIQTEELTKEELIAGLKDVKNDEVEYKTLKAFRKFQKIANAMRMPTMATRFNSISSAVGPLIIDNLMTEYQMQKLSSEGNILGPDGEAISMEAIFAAHPILNQFRKTLGIAQSLFGNMPANSTGFRNIVDSLADTPVGDIIMSDRKLLSKLSDFYQSYLVVAGGVVDASRLESVIGEFPKNFIKEQYKQKYADNLLIQSIKYGTDKGGRATLQVDITGLDTDQKERLGNAWTDLHKVNPELSLKLFEYCFFRGGIGFNPKTFMSLIPVTVKEKIPKYVDTFRVLPDSIPKIVIDQFIRNNWDNNKLVPRERNLYTRNITDEVMEVYKEEDIERLKDTQFFKMKVGNEDRLYEQLLVLDNSIQYKRIKPLGSNKDYLEISMNDISKPIEDTTEAIDIEDETGIIRTNPEEDTSREDDALTDAQVTDLLYQAYMASGISKEAVDDIVEKYRKKSERDKANFEKGVKNFLRKRFDLLNIKYDESLIDKVYDKLC